MRVPASTAGLAGWLLWLVLAEAVADGCGAGVTSTGGALLVTDVAGAGGFACPFGRIARAVPVAAPSSTRAAAEVATAR